MINRFVLLVIVLVTFSCTKDENSDIKEINYGTSFGECIGYCITTMIVDADSIKVIKGSWLNSVIPIKYSDPVKINEWIKLCGHFDKDSFFNMKEIYGCPDCADGGAEWLEIVLDNGEHHKVTFEYHNEPDELNEPVIILRDFMEQVIGCDYCDN